MSDLTGRHCAQCKHPIEPGRYSHLIVSLGPMRPKYPTFDLCVSCSARLCSLFHLTTAADSGVILPAPRPAAVEARTTADRSQVANPQDDIPTPPWFPLTVEKAGAQLQATRRFGDGREPVVSPLRLKKRGNCPRD